MDASIDKAIEILSQVGFPIVVSLYCLMTLNKKLDSLVLSVQGLDKTIGGISTHMMYGEVKKVD